MANCTADVLFEYLRMPFGLQSAPEVFQRLMQRVLERLNPRIAILFLDDVIVHSSGFENTCRIWTPFITD